MFVKASLRTDDGSEGSEPIHTGDGQMLAVQLAEPFLLAKAVELGGNDGGGALVGGSGDNGTVRY